MGDAQGGFQGVIQKYFWLLSLAGTLASTVLTVLKEGATGIWLALGVALLLALAWNAYVWWRPKPRTFPGSPRELAYTLGARAASSLLIVVPAGLVVFMAVHAGDPWSLPAIQIEIANRSTEVVDIEERAEVYITGAATPATRHVLASGVVRLRGPSLRVAGGDHAVVAAAVVNPGKYRRLFTDGDASLEIVLATTAGIARSDAVAFDATLAREPLLVRVGRRRPIDDVVSSAAPGTAFEFANAGGKLAARYQDGCGRDGTSGVQIVYEMVDGEANGGWGVSWGGSGLDASGQRGITFWTRGTSSGELFQIGLKDVHGVERKVESSVIGVTSKGWMQWRLPWAHFPGVSPSSLENLSLGFNRTHGSGELCVDAISFY